MVLTPSSPFTRTHARRRDGLRAMLLFVADGRAHYRIKTLEGRRTVDRLTSADAARFQSEYTEVS